MTSHEECMREAAECDRLAGLAATLFTRNMMKVTAFHWRKLAHFVSRNGYVQTSTPRPGLAESGVRTPCPPIDMAGGAAADRLTAVGSACGVLTPVEITLSQNCPQSRCY